MLMPNFTDDIARLVPHLRRFARALVCGHSAQFADDLVQETVVLAMRAERIAAGANLSGWCFATLMRVHRLRCQGGASDGGETAPRPDPAVAFLPKPIARLDLLSLDCREALLLTVLAGMTYAQAAEALHVALDVLMHRLDLARAHLAKSDLTLPSGALGLATNGRASRHSHHLRLVK